MQQFFSLVLRGRGQQALDVPQGSWIASFDVIDIHNDEFLVTLCGNPENPAVSWEMQILRPGDVLPDNWTYQHRALGQDQVPYFLVMPASSWAAQPTGAEPWEKTRAHLYSLKPASGRMPCSVPNMANGPKKGGGPLEGLGELEGQILHALEQHRIGLFGEAHAAGYIHEAFLTAFGPRLAREEQLQVQLAGCLLAAEGGTSAAVVATRGDYGWSPAYQATLDLRRAFDRLVDREEHPGVSPADGNGYGGNALDAANECRHRVADLSAPKEGS